MNGLRVLLVAALVTAGPALAGCIGGDEEPVKGAEADAPAAGAVERVELKADKGAVAGLVVDDAFRPIPNALVLAQEIGRTTRSNANGEFQMVDLQPGALTLRVEAQGHEASPKKVDVKAGEYAETTLVARRVANTHGEVITREFTVFIPCAADFVVNGIVWNCMLDFSGDSYRASFVSNYTNMTGITYMVTEMKANQVGSYVVQVREDDGSSSGGVRYAVANVKDSDYVKIVNKLNETNEEHNGQNNNVPWDNDRPFRTILFMTGDHQETFKSLGDTVCAPLPVSCLQRGLGARFGIEARFVQSLFIGEPTVNIDNYATMSPG